MGEKLTGQGLESLDDKLTVLCDRLGAADYVFGGGIDPKDGRVLLGIQLTRDGYEPLDTSTLPIRDESGNMLPGCELMSEDGADFLDFEGDIETFSKVVDVLTA